MKAAIYSRVSTDRQSHDSQLHELRDYCRRQGWENVKEYADTISGSKFSRTGLDQLLEAIRRGRIRAVVCFRLDRLGRSLAHLVQVIGELQRNNAALIVPAQGIDTSSNNPASQLQLNILGAIAEFERAIISERVNAGLAAAQARGTRLGRPPKAHKHLEAVTALKEQGWSIRQIAAELGISASMVARLARTKT